MKAIVESLVAIGISYGLFKAFQLAYDKYEEKDFQRLKKEYQKGYNAGRQDMEYEYSLKELLHDSRLDQLEKEVHNLKKEAE